MFTDSDMLCYLGSAREEFWVGETVREGFAGHVAEIPDYEHKPTLVKAFERGETGWALWVGDVRFPGREHWETARFSFVLALEDGVWKVVYVNNSFATENSIISGIDYFAFNALLEAAQADMPQLSGEGAATIMFTDVAHSTKIANQIGDRAWAVAIGRLLDAQGEAITAEGGKVVKTLGDGAMASFPSAGSALRAAKVIQKLAQDDTAQPKLEVRVGVHAGDSADFAFGEPTSVALRGIEGLHQISELTWHG